MTPNIIGEFAAHKMLEDAAYILKECGLSAKLHMGNSPFMHLFAASESLTAHAIASANHTDRPCLIHVDFFRVHETGYMQFEYQPHGETETIAASHAGASYKLARLIGERLREMGEMKVTDKS